MVISSAAGELTLGIGLGFVSVGLGILGLIIKVRLRGALVLLRPYLVQEEAQEGAPG